MEQLIQEYNELNYSVGVLSKCPSRSIEEHNKLIELIQKRSLIFNECIIQGIKVEAML